MIPLIPPATVLADAVRIANLGPCAKSQRGVVIYMRATELVIGHAWNSPPLPFDCTATDACKRVCRKVAVHAEERAILEAQLGLDGGRHCDLVHVKTVNRQLVPGGPPSCLQCSRLVVEVGVHVWLYEGTPIFDRECLNCRYVHSYRAASPESDLEHCPRCHTELEPLSRARYEHPASWRRYHPHEFHRATLKNNGITGLDPRPDPEGAIDCREFLCLPERNPSHYVDGRHRPIKG